MTQTISIDQGSSPPELAVTDQIEIDRFATILGEHLEVNSAGKACIAVSFDGATKLLPIATKRDCGNARSWASAEYLARFPGAKRPKLANFEDARALLCMRIAPSEDTQEEPQEKRGRGRPKSKLTEEDREAINTILDFADWKEDGPYPGSLFVRVPYLTDTRGLALGDDPAKLSRRYTGMWYMAGQEKPPTRLMDAALYYADVTYPHASAKNRPHSGTLQAVNSRGREKSFPFTGNELRDRENNKFKNFAQWPQDIPNQSRLLNCMEALYTSDPRTRWHEQLDHLGYAETDQGLIFALCNGIETARGFIANENAPIIGADLISAGNGYQGTEERLKPSEDVYRAIFECIAECDQVRIAAKLGALMYTWFPPGCVENAGRLPFYIETIGTPSCGKTPEDNFIKAHQGLHFRYDSPPFLTNDDTKASAPARMQIMKHLAYSDDDRKCSPGAPGFQSEHAARKRHINYYADGQGAGSRYYEHATRIASRGEPQGLALGTGNYDHAFYALSTPGLDEDPIEFRACTFVVGSRSIRSEENSRAIFEQKAALYAMGRAARAWLMNEYNRDKGALRDYIQDLGARANATMRDLFPYDWYESKQKNHCQVLIWGLLAWIDFLGKYGPGREQGYLYGKLSSLLGTVVEDRAARAEYLSDLIKGRESGADLGEFVLDAIRATLAARRAYIVDQRGEPLTLADIPPDYGLSSFGYFQHTALASASDSPDYQWDHAHVPLGHYMKRSRTVAFSMNELYASALTPYAREQKRDLPRIDELKKRLLESGLISEKQQWIQGRNLYYIVIDLDKLDLPGRELVDLAEEEERADGWEALNAQDKVVNIEQARAGRGISAQVAQGEKAVNGDGAPILGEIEYLDPFDFDPME